MRDPNSIKLAIGYYPGRLMHAGNLECFAHASARLAGYFSPRSISFWTHETDWAMALRRLIKASVFENYRQPLDYLILINNLDCLDIQTVSKLLECTMKSNEAGGAILRRKDNEIQFGRVFDMVVLPLRWVCKIAESRESAEWLASANGGNPDHTFLGFLCSLGCPLLEIYNDMRNSKAGHTPYPCTIPSEVHFLPAMSVAASSLPIGEISAKISSAFNTISSLPDNARVAVYGAGTIGRALLPALGRKAVLIIDRNPELKGTHLNGIRITAPEDIAIYNGEFDRILISVVGREPEVRATLAKYLRDSYKNIQILNMDGNCDGLNEKTCEVPAPKITNPAAIPDGPPKAKVNAADLVKTTERTITRRAVLYVGYLCNIRCRFCYYAHSDAKEWHTIDECKRDATLYRQNYGNECVDITGGEPTVYPRIMELLDHCSQIGLQPSIITNMQALKTEDKLRSFCDHGVYDFLCSIHGIGNVYNHITNTTNGWSNIIKATMNLERVGMRWRANCTMVDINMHQLKDIARYAYDYGARVINFINYNPFYEWASRLDIDFQARHSEIAPHLSEALQFCDSVGLEANVRYMPFCQIRGHEEKCYNYSQLSYDHHEWDYCSWYSDATRNPSSKIPRWLIELADDKDTLHALLAQHNKDAGFSKPAACQSCALGYICDGPTTQYARRYGVDEFLPYQGTTILDPAHFIKRQNKVVDESLKRIPFLMQIQGA
jgi:MoaA/NifB/PqqE/SkfB family radical SAM enzyme